MNTGVGLIVALLCCVGGYKLAESKKRNPMLWAVLCFIFGLLALIPLAIIGEGDYTG